MKVPKIKKITKDKQIEILRDEIKRKDEIIAKLKEEKELLFKVSLKNKEKK